MLPETLQAALLVVVAVLPGALYVWGYERYVGKWELNSPDRLLRFLAASAIFQLIAAPVTYPAWHHYFRDVDWSGRGRFPPAAWVIAALYLLVPYVLGTLIGSRTTGETFKLRRLWTRISDPPTAWDFFFAARPDGWLRVRLKTGAWVGGAYASGSFASGYPERRDLFIVQAAELDPQTGLFETDANGSVRLRDEQILVDGENIDYLEFTDG